MSAGANRLPDFVILGAAKAGTTSLARWLADNAEIFVARDKELNFFSNDDVFATGVDWYSQCFADNRARVVGEASPSYLPSHVAPQRMAATIPHARLFALLRDPVDRAQSHYWWMRNWGVETRTFEEAVIDEMAGRGEQRYLVESKYVEHLARYTDYFPRKSLTVLFFDELSSDPLATYRSVCTTLGVPAEPIPGSVGEVFNASTRVRSRRLWRWAGRITGRSWRSSGPLRGVDRVLASRRGYSALDPDLEVKLRDYFEEYDTALASWLELRTLPWQVTRGHPALDDTGGN